LGDPLSAFSGKSLAHYTHYFKDQFSIFGAGEGFWASFFVVFFFILGVLRGAAFFFMRAAAALRAARAAYAAPLFAPFDKEEYNAAANYGKYYN